MAIDTGKPPRVRGHRRRKQRMGLRDRVRALRAARFERQMPKVTALEIYEATGHTPLPSEEFQRRFGHLPTK